MMQDENMCGGPGKVLSGKRDRTVINVDRRLRLNAIAVSIAKQVTSEIADNDERQMFIGMLATLIDTTVR